MATDKLEGGCLCGKTRYAVRGNPVAVAFCHCTMCRRSVGSPAIPWAMFESGGFEFVGDEPKFHASSEGVQRGFCGQCGTSLTFTAEFLPGLIDITVGSFDDPTKLPPQMHIWESKRLPWIEMTDALPRHQEFPPQE